MKIAIDIDNTLLRCRSIVYKIMSQVEKLVPVKVSKNPVEIKKGEARIFANKHRNFLFGRLGNVKMYEEIDGAIEVINKLCENGHSVMFLSNRPNIRFLNNVVMTWLEQNKVQYDLVVINCGDKLKFCKEHGVDLLIDDSLRNCKNVSDAGINTILFGAKKIDKEYYVDLSKSFNDYNMDFLTMNPKQFVYMAKGNQAKVKLKETPTTLYYATTWKDVSNVIDKDLNYTTNELQNSK